MKKSIPPLVSKNRWSWTRQYSRNSRNPDRSVAIRRAYATISGTRHAEISAKRRPTPSRTVIVPARVEDRADRGPPAGLRHERACRVDLRPHRAGGELGAPERLRSRAPDR